MKGVVVDLGPGVWRFSRQVRFDESDSGVRGAPIVWRGAADGSTVLTASREIPLASFGPVTDEKVLRRIDPSVRDRIRVADVSGLDISEPVLHRELGLTPLEIPDVFCDGTWLPMACWPNADIDGFFRDEAWAKIPRILERGAFGDAAKGDDLAGKGGLFAYAGDRPSRWVDAPTVFLQGFWSHDWWESVIPLECIDPTNRTIRLKFPHRDGLKSWHGQPRRWRALHLVEELDRPGEYWFDFSEKRLYLYPPANARRVTVLTRGPALLALRGTHDLTFANMTIEEVRGGFNADGVSRLTLENLRIRHVHGGAAYIRNARECAIRRCDVWETGSGGFSLSGGDRKTLAPGFNVIEDCTIRKYALLQHCYANALTGGGVGTWISHNYIADAWHQAVCMGGNDGVFEYNVISNVVNSVYDSGAFYKGYNPSCRGNILRRNLFIDVRSDRAPGVNAVYFDDGDIGETVEECVFVRAGNVVGKTGMGAVFSHGGYSNVVRNCVFVDCKRALGSSPWDDNRWAKHVTNDILARVTSDVDIRKSPYLRPFVVL